jgi:hypothetical protein
MKNLVFVALSLLSFVMSPLSHSALIKDTYMIKTTDPLYWSMTYDSDSSQASIYKDGANGIGEFGKGDDLLSEILDAKAFVDSGEADFYSDILSFDIDGVFKAAAALLFDLKGTTIDSYDNHVLTQTYAVAYSIDNQVSMNVQADAWGFGLGHLFDGRTVSVFYVFNCLDLSGGNCSGEKIDLIYTDTELVSREFLSPTSDVPAPNSLAIFGISLFFLVRRNHAKS